ALPAVEGTSEPVLRRRLVAWLELDRMAANGGEPVAILEVGIGTGANLAYVADALPPDRAALVWGVDLSRTMLARCARRARTSGLDVRLAIADAHALPFANATFDRVFHIGGIGSFRDPGLALAEMARVAKPGASIVVSDEELDGRAHHGLLARAAFRALTFNQRRPRAPVDALPAEATDIEVDFLSTFYFVLRFRRAA
ncbi:MAG TPA: class I SAM-dependent methyltransferase, partial [Polyangiaceae bacterium]|nr:class I SAM-dependent methyltransferase [Polyangiaceae bacterium]